MKVHRCPHCGKPFLEGEAPAGKCPVCQGVVWEAPDPETTPAPEQKADRAPDSKADLPKPPADTMPPPKSGPPLPENGAPRWIHSVAAPILMIVILGGATLWWFQVQDLKSQRDDLQKRLSEAENQGAGAPIPSDRATRVRKRPGPAVRQNLDENARSDRMRAALARIREDPNHQASQAILAAGMQADRAWIGPVSKLTPPPQWASAPLVGMLSHPDPETRRLAAEALGLIRPPGPLTQPVLTNATRDPDIQVRKAAQESLDKLRSGP